MYVKTVTLKGFKSFAGTTTMRLEPGITCIVGPNGSGKSNVVDALAWVMGEQGAKSLRGGKMEDVIFAGTAGRAPLGRAEVSLTIDNTDGALPIDYTEVTLSRTMFRSGGSEYAINGTHCRLLDIQELLSDSGIGREMHVIVGQGQLDAVLRATPEDRRGFIEEAAGVLKHRKRKERALRKLETMDANLMRVGDLLGEIRRQLGPLGRQAETARKAAVIQADARDARLRLLADDLAQLRSALDQENADETARRTAVDEVRERLVGLADRQRELDDAALAAAPQLRSAHDVHLRLLSLRERLDSVGSLAAERVRLLGQDDVDETTSGRDPEELRRQAAEAREAERALGIEVAAAKSALDQAVAQRLDAEAAHGQEQARVAGLLRAAADRREGLATLRGRVATSQSRIEAREAERTRLISSRDAALVRAAEAEQKYTALEASIADDEAGEIGLDAAYERASAALTEAEATLAGLLQTEADLDRERGRALARLDALTLSLARKDGAASLLARPDQEHGIAGRISDVLTVRPGYEAAVAAALGRAAEALVVPTVGQASAALATLRATDGGWVALVTPDTARAVREATGELPAGALWALEVVSAPDEVWPAVADLLSGVVLVQDAGLTDQLVRAGRTVVTAQGDIYAPSLVAGGGTDSGPSLIELQAAAAETEAAAAAASARLESLAFELKAARDRVAVLTEDATRALDALHESDAKMTAVAEQLGALGIAIRSARAEADRTTAAVEASDAAVADALAEAANLQERLDRAIAEPAEEADPDTGERDRLDALATAARAAETEARLVLRTREERARALRGRAESLEGAARNEVAARERLAARRAARMRELQVAVAVQRVAVEAAERIAKSSATAERRRGALESARAEREVAVVELRRTVDAAQEQLRELTDSMHRDEVARAANLAHVESIEAKAIEEHGIDPDTLVELFGPHLMVPVVTEDPDAPQESIPYVRDEQAKRLRKAERGLAALGRVNPLALEEFAALEERHAFLTQQVEDLKASKADLLHIVKEVDERVEQVFAEAFADTAAQFERVFERLFPGGEGRLVLTDPDDMLTTGIEVEARPAGKKIKRLSLLSGGERSLTAVALLVSIFKARPSPFYIMDEVEAALDDTNLGRLITLLEELRDSSQLIVITHQKRTMEIADALYGVSMRGDGVTTVVSQRLRDIADAPAS